LTATGATAGLAVAIAPIDDAKPAAAPAVEVLAVATPRLDAPTERDVDVADLGVLS
jgi:hypothetical protein